MARIRFCRDRNASPYTMFVCELWEEASKKLPATAYSEANVYEDRIHFEIDDLAYASLYRTHDGDWNLYYNDLDEKRRRAIMRILEWFGAAKCREKPEAPIAVVCTGVDPEKAAMLLSIAEGLRKRAAFENVDVEEEAVRDAKKIMEEYLDIANDVLRRWRW